tara:strand:- start:435 stop:1145 length:711 start_codon:yes stop_codon:yes gene_type:complete
MTSNLSYANNNKLTISVPPFPPFNSFTENPHCLGVSVLAIKAVTKNLQVKLELMTYPYTRILHSLKTGELDLALIFKNSTHENHVEYIGPLSLSEVIVLTRSNISIQRYHDLYKLKNIAVIRNAQFHKTFDQDTRLNKVNVDSYDQAIRMLKSNRVDGVVGSRVGIQYALSQQNIALSLMANAYTLGSKEWGLHLAKKSPFITLLPLLTTAVKNTYQEDLIYQLYQQQVEHCLSAQ